MYNILPAIWLPQPAVYLSVLFVLIRVLLSWVLGFISVMTCMLACSIKKVILTPTAIVDSYTFMLNMIPQIGIWNQSLFC